MPKEPTINRNSTKAQSTWKSTKKIRLSLCHKNTWVSDDADFDAQVSIEQLNGITNVEHVNHSETLRNRVNNQNRVVQDGFKSSSWEVKRTFGS